MLDGWYCRTMKAEAHNQGTLDQCLADADNSESMENENDSSALEDNSEDEGSGNRNIDFKAKYKNLKRKVKILVYENVYFQNNLRAGQRRLLKVTRDCSFLLDRLMAFERPELSSSDNDRTDSSDDSSKLGPTLKRRKAETLTIPGALPPVKNLSHSKRTKKGHKKQQHHQNQIPFEELPTTSYGPVLPTISLMEQKATELLTNTSNLCKPYSAQYDLLPHEGQFTKEEIERHLQSRQKLPEVFPEGELPSEMFNNSPSSESNENLPETSPCNLAKDCLSVDLDSTNV